MTAPAKPRPLRGHAKVKAARAAARDPYHGLSTAELAQQADELEIEGLADRARELEGAPPLLHRTPAALATHLDPTYLVPLHIELIHKAVVRTLRKRSGRLIVLMPPQEGKSQSIAHWGALWALLDNPATRIAIASYSDDLATRWGRAIRENLSPTAEVDLGLRIKREVSAAARWELRGHLGGMFCTSLPGGELTGHAVDVLVIDDPVKDRIDARNKIKSEAVWDWWTSVAIPRLGPGVSVLLVQTRWHELDLAGRLIAEDDAREARGERRMWEVLRIPAQADHDPAKGEVDPLGREPGEYLPSARGRTTADWEQTKQAVGATVWSALYQGKPTPDEGDVFDRGSWRYYTEPLWTVRADKSRIPLPPPPGVRQVLLVSWDMAFKDKKTSDYVVGQVWMRRGADAFLLDQVRGRMSFTKTLEAARALHAKWPTAAPTLVEDKANGTAVLDSLRKVIPGLVGVSPKESKLARAEAVSPYQESGNVWLPSEVLAGWVGGLVEEATQFPNGTHDDQVDTLTQALNRLFLKDAGAAGVAPATGRIERAGPGGLRGRAGR